MFTVFLFTPFDLFLHNPTDFVVSWKFLALPLIMFSILGFVVLSAMLLLLWYRKAILGAVLLFGCGAFIICARLLFSRFLTISMYLPAIIIVAAIVWFLLIKLLKEKAIDAVLLVMWGAAVIAYVQMLFLNGGMSLITGDKAGYGVLTPGHLLNLFIWVVVTLLPLCIWIFFRRRKKEFKYEKALIFTVLLIAGMQIAGLAVTALSVQLPVGIDEQDEVKYFSYESAVELSAEGNICVFLLDRLDVEIMTEALTEYPELYEMLDGFTFYSNNTAEFISTFPSVTTMLTQHYYRDGLTFSDYWKEAWAQDTAIDALRENGFTTNLYIDKLSTYGEIREIENRTDNLITSDLGVNLRRMLNLTGRLSLGRMAPYLCKNVFLSQLDSAFGNGFFTIGANTYEIQQPGIGIISDIIFYNFVKRSEFSADSEKRVFNFIHLNCSHESSDKNVTSDGYSYNAESDTIEYGGNYLDSTRACFEILNFYFGKMKELDVYDNSTIILLGDHGARYPAPWEGTVATTGLLIKPRGASGALKADNETGLSNEYFGASLLEAAGIPHDALGISYFDAIGAEGLQVRRFYCYSNWWDEQDKSEKVKLDSVYEITGDANDSANWKYVG
jgi:hypothetical protein